MFSLCLCVLQEATVFAQISAADARNASGLELSFHTATAISDLASACGLKISKHLIQSIREGTLSSNISAEVNKFTQEPDCLKASRQYFIIQNELHYRANYNLLQAQKKAFRLTV